MRSACFAIAVLLISPPIIGAQEAPYRSGVSTAIGEAAPKPSAAELRQAVSNSLRQEATTKGAENERAVRNLIAVYRQLRDDSALVKSSRDRLTNLVRNRLTKVASRLEKERPDTLQFPEDLKLVLAQQLNQFGQAIAQAPAGVDPGEALVELIKTTIEPNTWVERGGAGAAMFFPPLRQVGVFGNQVNVQQGGGFGAARQGGAFGAADDDDGEELVELIQTVIAPDSWDVNGGPGSIYYWKNWRVLVVRQTDDVHENLGGAVEQLRRAGN